MADAARDGNFVTTLTAVSSSDGTTPVKVYADPTTHRLLVDLASGNGTVTSVSVATANGFAGTVATATTTPAITLTTTVTGILSGNGTAISAASTTGSGDVVLATSPTLVTPLLGTPTSGTLTNCTGYTVANLSGAGTGVLTALAINVGSAGAFVTFNGAGGTPSSMTATNLTGTAAGLTAGTASAVAVGGITGLGTNVATALAVNVGSAGAFVVNGGALGTPSSGTVTNLTGTASININGTVGATTPTTGVFTTATVNTGLMPDANDGAYLGQAGTAFSDLFLAEGGVINWDSGDATLTQTGNVLELAGADLTVPNITIGAAGVVTLLENASIALDPAGSADGKYTGITIAGTAGAALAFGDLCYLASADSRWELADADAATTADRMLGMCVLAAGADGNATTMLLIGQIRADAAFPALTIGSAVYVGETAGDIQVSIPTGADNVIRRVGYALTADEIYFNPSMDSQITVA